MEKNEQMDTHATEEDREKERKVGGRKEGEMMKPNDDTVYLRRDKKEALRKMTDKNGKLLEKGRRKNGKLLTKG